MTAAIIARLERGNINEATLRTIHALLGLSERRESPDAGRPTARSRADMTTGSQTHTDATQRAGNGAQ